ncbi:MAG: hypothetical protein KGL73_07525 [Burkholderiales bacterium]|nr:hypothetical protein [Burkholderiales bacterium]
MVDVDHQQARGFAAQGPLPLLSHVLFTDAPVVQAAQGIGARHDGQIGIGLFQFADELTGQALPAHEKTVAEKDQKQDDDREDPEEHPVGRAHDFGGLEDRGPVAGRYGPPHPAAPRADGDKTISQRPQQHDGNQPQDPPTRLRGLLLR